MLKKNPLHCKIYYFDCFTSLPLKYLHSNTFFSFLCPSYISYLLCNRLKRKKYITLLKDNLWHCKILICLFIIIFTITFTFGRNFLTFSLIRNSSIKVKFYLLMIDIKKKIYHIVKRNIWHCKKYEFKEISKAKKHSLLIYKILTVISSFYVQIFKVNFFLSLISVKISKK